MSETPRKFEDEIVDTLMEDERAALIAHFRRREVLALARRDNASWYDGRDARMQKDFDRWNHSKKNINAGADRPFYHAREIWWCAVGVNVGNELDGTGKHHDRPVLVLRPFNAETLFWKIDNYDKSDPISAPKTRAIRRRPNVSSPSCWPASIEETSTALPTKWGRFL